MAISSYLWPVHYVRYNYSKDTCSLTRELNQIEELSNQNEDLIDKLKESMERELVLRCVLLLLLLLCLHIY